MRSRTGCLTCRSRKLKCDEKRPQCTQCRRGGRECRPSEGIVFRHHQNASLNKDDSAHSGGRGSLQGFYSYKNTFDENSVWLEIPKQVTFVDNSDPYTEELETSLASPGTPLPNRPAWNNNGSYQHAPIEVQPHGLEALSAAATRDTFTLQQHVNSMAVDPSMSRNNVTFNLPDIPQQMPSIPSPNQVRNQLPPTSPSASISSSNNNINFLLNPSTSLSPPIDPSLHSPDERRDSPFPPNQLQPRSYLPQGKDVNVETDHEIAFLLRHFSEGPGQWMDLFDLRTYFASYVPVKALTNPLLKYASCAYAAKQLGRVKGAKAVFGGVCSRQASMEVWPSAEKKVDWYYHGAKYYEKAIQLLMQALKHDSQGPPLSNPEAFGQWQAAELVEGAECPHKRRRRFSNSRLSSAHSDEVLAATAILSIYEFLDATGPAWNRHLSGVKSLLDIAEVGMLPLEQQLSPDGTPLPPPKKHGFSRARRATFWNFARQDYLSAFINDCQSRLNTEDLDLWVEAGLLIDDMGFVKPSNTTDSEYSGDDVMKEDLISNALVWILSKIVNFLAAGDGINVNNTHQPEGSRIGVSQHVLIERWQRLQAELDAWYNGLPDTFKPCARIQPPPESSTCDTYAFPEIWFSIPMCASSMQHYHMARILMLINKPHESTSRRSTVTNRLKSYRSIESEIRYHSHEICGIAMSRPEASVRIHSVQPLYVSGQCMSDPRERRGVLELLKGVERDLGWATEYRIQQLLREWEWDENAYPGSVVS